MNEATVRPMTSADVEAVRLVTEAALAGLEAATGVPEPPASPPEHAQLRIEHLLATDPGGCWVGEQDGQVTGAAIALVREGIWGLALLMVDPARQSAGLGRALLERAAAHGEGARGRMILSSADPRAMSMYMEMGLELRPAATAAGRPRALELSGNVRPGGPKDAELIAEVDRIVRGAAHGSDIDALTAVGNVLLVFPGRGYALHNSRAVKLLAALDDEAAAELLRAALAGAGEDGMEVDFVTGDQQWAVQVCREAGLRFHLGWSAVLVGGEVGPLRPYIPSGTYL